MTIPNTMLEKNVFGVILTLSIGHPLQGKFLLLIIITLISTLVVPSQQLIHYNQVLAINKQLLTVHHSMRPNHSWVISHSVMANRNLTNQCQHHHQIVSQTSQLWEMRGKSDASNRGQPTPDFEPSHEIVVKTESSEQQVEQRDIDQNNTLNKTWSRSAIPLS